MQTMDEPNNGGQAISTETMDGSEGVPDLTQLYLQEGPSQTSPRPSTPAHQTEPSLSPAPLLPTPHLILQSVPLEVLAKAPTKPISHRDLGARPKRDGRPPDYYGFPRRKAASQVSHSLRSKRTHFSESASSVPTGCSDTSRHSRDSRHAPNLSDLQASILQEKGRKDELEELKRQQLEDKQLDEKCKLIDERARAAQQCQENAHKEREKMVRQVEMNRRIRTKEQELESAQHVTSFIKHNLSEEDGGACGPTTSCLHGNGATSSFYDLPPSRIFTPAPPNLTYADSRSHLALAPLLPQLSLSRGLPKASQIIPRPQPIQQSLYTAQAPSLPSAATAETAATSTPHVAAQALPSSFHPASATVMPRALSIHHGPVTSVTAEAPNNMISMTGSEQPTFTGSLQPTQAMSSQQQSVYPHVQFPNVTDLLIASAYGIPRPSIPVFKSGREKDFALMKMALDNILDNHPHLTEQYKYQILLEHVQHPGASKLARSSMHDARPYSTALLALKEKYGQPRLLVQREIGEILNAPIVHINDVEAFHNLSLSIQSMLWLEYCCP